MRLRVGGFWGSAAPALSLRGFRVEGLESRVQGSEFGVKGSEFMVQVSGFRV